MAEAGEESGSDGSALDRTIMVRGFGGKDFLELYFENPKYGGGEIESLQICGPSSAKIVFKDKNGMYPDTRQCYLGKSSPLLVAKRPANFLLILFLSQTKSSHAYVSL